jgi:uncharacterized Fe-S cluster-containing radical SAM superfamily protein
MKRKYEMFMDDAYYGMYCVRDISNRNFNSATSWHFPTKEKAEEFLKIIRKAN